MTVIKTQPEVNGAPLPGGPETPLPNYKLSEVEAELERARVELMYGLAMQRKAWARVRARAQEIEAEAARMGTTAFADSDARYKIAIGDVRFWREGITAQAAAIAALESMRAESIVRATAPPLATTVREHVLSWDAVSRPSKLQYDSALAWTNMAGDRQDPVHRRLCERIIDAYERR